MKPPAQLPFKHLLQRPSRTRGFTLLELLVVLLILGLLAGYVGPALFGKVGDARVKTARSQIDGFTKSLDQYRLDTGHYPSTEQGLAALRTKPSDETKWAGPYLTKDVPADPWDKPYQYKMPGTGHEFDIISLGGDGRVGGDGENADISAW